MSQHTARRERMPRQKMQTPPSPGPARQNTGKPGGYAGPSLSQPATAA